MKMVTWKVEQMDRQASDGLVTTVHWRATEQDGDDVASAYGSVGLERGDSFIEYDSLTEAQVVAWIKEKVKADTIEANLAAEIAAKKTPVTLTGTPW
jgi:hypothetical protein